MQIMEADVYGVINGSFHIQGVFRKEGQERREEAGLTVGRPRCKEYKMREDQPLQGN